MAPIKELHIFDVHYLPSLCGFYGRRRRAELQNFGHRVADLSPRQVTRMRALQTVQEMHSDHHEYVRYFEELSGGGTYAVGEITPSYSMLSGPHFSAIKALLEERFKVRIVFLMRDPIERCHSALRMKYNELKARGKTPEITPEDRFRVAISLDRNRLRTQYERTIVELEQAFDKEDIYYGFYESLFQEAEIRRLCDFLNIDFAEPNYDQRPNPSPRTSALAPDDIEYARDFFASTYDFCAKRFGTEVIRKNWKWYDQTP